MGEPGHFNGHRASGMLNLLHPALRGAPKPERDTLPFDLDSTLKAVVPLRAEIFEDAFTAPFLGIEREGSGIVIDDQGLILTIGYLIAEARQVTVGGERGMVPADLVAYDYETGFGLVRASPPLDARPIPFGSVDMLERADAVIVGTQGGFDQSIAATVVSKREFAGYWEYLLDQAVFTSPPHPNWGGAALIGEDGLLLGVGSLYVEDAIEGPEAVPGNMFVPIDLLKPVFDDLIHRGRSDAEPRPWLGMFTAESGGHLVVAGVAPGGPADRAGIRRDDILLTLDGQLLAEMATFYRQLWSLGPAGVDIRLGLAREGDNFEIKVRTGDRYSFMKLSRRQ